MSGGKNERSPESASKGDEADNGEDMEWKKVNLIRVFVEAQDPLSKFISMDGSSGCQNNAQSCSYLMERQRVISSINARYTVYQIIFGMKNNDGEGV